VHRRSADCDEDATLSNNNESYDCSCNNGYTGDGFKCSDINKCKEGIHICDVNAECANNVDGAELVEKVLKATEQLALISMSVPMDSTVVMIQVIATISLAHSLVVVKINSSARVVSAKISMSARKVWITVTRMPPVPTKTAASNANVSQVSWVTVSTAMTLTNAW